MNTPKTPIYTRNAINAYRLRVLASDKRTDFLQKQKECVQRYQKKFKEENPELAEEKRLEYNAKKKEQRKNRSQV